MLNMIKFAVNSCTNNSANLLWAWCVFYPAESRRVLLLFPTLIIGFVPWNLRTTMYRFSPAVQLMMKPVLFFSTSTITENKTSRYKVILQDINIHVNVFLLCCTCCNTQWQYFSFHVDVHIFLLWMLSLCEQNAFFFLLLSRYCSNKISSNETSICFLWHFIGAEDLKRWCNQMIPVWVAFGLTVCLIKSKISYQIQSTNSRSNCFYIICVNCDKNANLSTSM